jgi:hypothetical protein
METKKWICVADYTIQLVVIGAILIFALGLGAGLKIGFEMAAKQQDTSQNAR